MHTLKPAYGARRKKFRVGRGHGSGLGTTAGRGTKGQRARTGGRKGLHRLGMRNVLLQLPKLRGFSRGEHRCAISLEQLSRWFEDGARVTVKGLRRKGCDGSIKVLGGGTIRKRLHLAGVAVSASAKIKIIAAGGTVS